MADLALTLTRDGGEITVVNGKPKMTDGLFNAVYLSLFTGAWWGNLVGEDDEQYSSILSEVMSGQLTDSTKNDVLASVRSALSWMTSSGIADEIIIDAELNGASRLDMSIKIVKPDNIETYAYSLNWDAQEVALT